MSDDDYATYAVLDGRPSVRFERLLPHPPERVWAAVSTSEGLGAWFPSQVEISLRDGGPLRFFDDPNLPDTMTGEVLELTPPRLLAFTWGYELLHFKLLAEELGAATRLIFTHVVQSSNTAARNAAGWHVCLDVLGAELDGTPHNGVHDPDGPWRALYEEYVERRFPSGAPIPGQG